MYLIDTDVVISYLNGRTAEVALLQGLLPDGLALSAISYGELYEGIVFSSDRARELANFRRFLRSVQVLNVNQRVARQFAQIRGTLRQQGLLLPAPDLLIAATALAYDLILVTRNLRHFQRIPGLRIYPQL